MPGPADVAAIAERVYFRHSPVLGVHSPCRLFSAIAAGICTALDVDYTLKFDRNYTEDGVTTQHFWVEFPNGSTLDLWGLGRHVRLIERQKT